jgi:hypothetical protein
MNADTHFGASWCNVLKIVTGLCFVLCFGLPLAAAKFISADAGVARWLVFIVPPLIVLGCAPFMVRSYTLSRDTLIIQRLGWTTRFDLAALTSATFDANAMNWGLRLCGIGGLFVFCGWYWNKKLGRFRAFLTDPKNSVVLRFGDRVAVVTPDEPERFSAEINERRHSLQTALS